MSAKIFISHSCKDLELKKSDRKNADKVTRWKRLNYACLVREKIVDGLGKPKKGGGLGYKVLLDKDRLEPGDDWRAKLHGWLGTCDGAVILLSEDSIQSDWLRKEATILTWCKSLRSELLLVPVFLGDLRSNALTECGLGCLHLADEEAARLAPDDDLPGDSWKVEDLTDRDRELHASCLAQKVLDKFNNLSSLNVPTHMEKWVRDVAGQLAQLADKKQHFLDEARRALRIHDKDWNDDEEYLQEHDLLGRTSMLANQLLTAPFDRVINAMNGLRQGMHREDFESLASRVACQWVDARAAQRLLPGTRPRKSKASDSRLLALNGNYVETASAYINRAYCCRLPLKRQMTVNQPVGGNLEKELRNNLEKSLCDHFHIPPKLARARLEKFVKKRDNVIGKLLKQQTFFAILDIGIEEAVPATVLEEMRAARGNITHLLLTGDDFSVIQGEVENLERVEPKLTEDAEDGGLADNLGL